MGRVCASLSHLGFFSTQGSPSSFWSLLGGEMVVPRVPRDWGAQKLSPNWTLAETGVGGGSGEISVSMKAMELTEPQRPSLLRTFELPIQTRYPGLPPCF